MNQIKIGRFIAKMRKNQSYTQRQLADVLGISDKTISKWETGSGLPEVSLMMPLCDALRINVNELLSGECLTDADYKERAEENMMDLVEERGKRMELNSMVASLTCENVVERMRCTESEKEEIMETIDLLCEMTETARQEGYSVLQEKYCDRMEDEFFQCAVALLTDSGSSEMMYECCLPYLLTSDLSGKEFAEKIIILIGLDKLIKGNPGVYLKILLKSYLGILSVPLG